MGQGQDGGVDEPRVSIGEFSRMTHLSAKALRLYHREGILVPAEVDPATGYRWYGLDQLARAQVVRRLRTLDVPLLEVRALLDAPSAALRADLLSAHLARKEAELARARATVDSLRRLLADAPPVLPVAVRRIPPTTVVSIRATITLAELGDWWTSAVTRLDDVVAAGSVRAVGPRGGLYSTELFAAERGPVAVFRPIDSVEVTGPLPVGVVVEVLPAVELAVARHDGPDADADRVYAALGRYVTERAIGVPGAIRETYLSGPFDDPSAPLVTEIGWPVFATADAPSTRSS